MEEQIKNQFNKSNFTNTEFHNYNGKKIPKHLGSIPVRPDVFVGRENSTNEIHKYFQGDDKKNVLLLVNGEGGIGKTTLASKYYHEFTSHYQHLIWLVSKKGIKQAIISLSLSLRIKFSPNLSQEQQVDEVLRYLFELKSPILLVIDNANNLKDLNESESLLLKFQNVDILITTRIDKHRKIENYKVTRLDKKSANTLFKEYYEAFQEVEQTLLNKLLNAVGYNTLVIELLAKNLHEFNTELKSHYPLHKLLEDIQKRGVLGIRKSVKIHSDYSLTATRPEEIITSMYNIVPLSNDEKQILSIFAIFSATVIQYDDLKTFLPRIEGLHLFLRDLSQKGWIDYDKETKSYNTNPIISEIIRTQDKNRIKNDTFYSINLILNRLNYQPGVGHIDGDFEEIKRMVGYAETLVNNSNLINYNLSKIFDRLGNFYQNYGNLEKALFFFEKYKMKKKEFFDSDPDNVNFINGLAISYSKLGSIHATLGNIGQAFLFLDDSMTLIKSLNKKFPNNLSFKNSLSISYSKLGEIYKTFGDLKTALTFLIKDMKLSEELHKSNQDHIIYKHELAISYEKLGTAHNEMYNSEKALFFFKKDAKLMEDLNKNHPTNVSFQNDLAIFYSKLGNIYVEKEKLNEALPLLEKYLILRERLYLNYPEHLGFKNGLANSYLKLAEVYNSLKKSEKAQIFLKKNLELRKKMCNRYPSHIGYKNGLATTYAKLGELYINVYNEKEKGIKYLEIALNLWEELIEKYPSHAEFQKFYTWIVNKLKSLGITYD